MRVREIMSEQVACCTANASLDEAAQLMEDYDCGAIPVVEGNDSRRLVGIITDRDITIRGVAHGDPKHQTVGDCMSRQITTVSEDADLEECCRIMEKQQIRRVPVVDARGDCCGIVSQADIARHGTEHVTAELVRDISEPAAGAREPVA